MIKNLRFLIMSLMLMVGATTFAQTVFDFDANGTALLGLPGESSGEGTDGDITETKTATIGSFSIAVSAAAEGAKTSNRLWSTSPKLRLYSGTLTISSTDANIKSIVFATKKWNAGNTASTGSLGALTSGSVTWSGDAKEIVISIAANTQISTITVSTEGGEVVPEPDPEPQPTEPTIEGGTTAETAITVAAALTAINTMSDGQKTTASYYVKGTVKEVKEISTEFGNATFTMVDAAADATALTAFRMLGLENQKITNPDMLQDGDVVVVYGQLQKYAKNGEVTPEIAQGGYIYSINGKTKEEVTPEPEPEPDPQPETTGEGTLESPYTVADALAVAGQLEQGETSEKDYYVKGKISSIKYTFDVQHGTATFNISDNGEAEKEFTCYGIFYLDNLSWQEGCTQIALGDEVIVFGKFTNYKGTLETASKKAYIYSLNGVTTSGIDEVRVSNRFKGAIFNMNGQRVTTPGKGLYIVNGKKFFRK